MYSNFLNQIMDRVKGNFSEKQQDQLTSNYNSKKSWWINAFSSIS